VWTSERQKPFTDKVNTYVDSSLSQDTGEFEKMQQSFNSLYQAQQLPAQQEQKPKTKKKSHSKNKGSIPSSKRTSVIKSSCHGEI
jgi:hypothetical protein